MGSVRNGSGSLTGIPNSGLGGGGGWHYLFEGQLAGGFGRNGEMAIELNSHWLESSSDTNRKSTNEVRE